MWGWESMNWKIIECVQNNKQLLGKHMNPTSKPKSKQILQKTLQEKCNPGLEFNHGKKHFAAFKTQREHANSEIKTKLVQGYNKLLSVLTEHIRSLQNVAKTVHSINDSYFLAISKIVEDERKRMNAILSAEIIKYEDSLKEHQRIVKQKLSDIGKRDINTQDQKMFESLTRIQKPTFHIEKSRIQEIVPLLKIIQPVYEINPEIYPNIIPSFKKQNRCESIETQPTDPNLNMAIIKKEGREVTKKVASQHQSTFDFSCNQQLNWEQTNRETKRHEIVSEIIFQEPSSCEDSLLSNQFS